MQVFLNFEQLSTQDVSSSGHDLTQGLSSIVKTWLILDKSGVNFPCHRKIKKFGQNFVIRKGSIDSCAIQHVLLHKKKQEQVFYNSLRWNIQIMSTEIYVKNIWKNFCSKKHFSKLYRETPINSFNHIHLFLEIVWLDGHEGQILVITKTLQ